MSDSFNPYALSEVHLEPALPDGERVPADPTQRILATLADWAIYGIFSMGSVSTAWWLGGEDTPGSLTLPVLLALAANLLLLLSFFANMVLLARRGQTIGKILLNIRVADLRTGRVPSFLRLFVLRVAPLWLLSCFSPILIGVELLMLYVSPGRTICDYMAGTQVVRGHPPAVS